MLRFLGDWKCDESLFVGFVVLEEVDLKGESIERRVAHLLKGLQVSRSVLWGEERSHLITFCAIG